MCRPDEFMLKFKITYVMDLQAAVSVFDLGRGFSIYDVVFADETVEIDRKMPAFGNPGSFANSAL